MCVIIAAKPVSRDYVTSHVLLLRGCQGTLGMQPTLIDTNTANMDL